MEEKLDKKKNNTAKGNNSKVFYISSLVKNEVTPHLD